MGIRTVNNSNSKGTHFNMTGHRLGKLVNKMLTEYLDLGKFPD
jgi:hypothetical protein